MSIMNNEKKSPHINLYASVAICIFRNFAKWYDHNKRHNIRNIQLSAIRGIHFNLFRYK